LDFVENSFFANTVGTSSYYSEGHNTRLHIPVKA